VVVKSEEAAVEAEVKLKAEAYQSESEMFPELLQFVREKINPGDASHPPTRFFLQLIRSPPTLFAQTRR
jgi:hypothetical protein